MSLTKRLQRVAEAHVPNDRARAYALWEGWFGYDRKKYAAMLREAFQPFELSIVEPEPQNQSANMQPAKDSAHTPLFAAQISRHPLD